MNRDTRVNGRACRHIIRLIAISIVVAKHDAILTDVDSADSSDFVRGVYAHAGHTGHIRECDAGRRTLQSAERAAMM